MAPLSHPKETESPEQSGLFSLVLFLRRTNNARRQP
nr:MAG TPA: hypothetical protein [Caudoviricetes sp.]